MLLAVDIGNTSTKFALFDGETLASRFSIPTIRDATAEDLKRAVDGRLDIQIASVVVCSVVPEVDAAVREFTTETTWVEPVFVNNSSAFGLRIDYRPLESLGTDRLVNAYAAAKKYGAPVIVCSLGTATTIDVVSGDHEFLGGVIAPGMDVLTEALHGRAPRLPRVDVERPATMLGNSTPASIQSGLYYGYVSMVEGLITRIRTETGVSRVIATGGNAEKLADEFAGIMTVDSDLLLDGLRMLAGK